MAVIYIEKAGIVFKIENGERIIIPVNKEDLSGLAFIIESGYKKYSSAPERFAHKVYKNSSYIIAGNTVYFYKAQDLDDFKANLSPYQILINNFLNKKGLSGNGVLLIDGNKDAVIVSLIINEEFKQILISNSQLINETFAEIKKYISKENIKLDKVVLNDAFYAPIFQNIKNIVLDETEIIKFAQDFNAPVFKKIEHIKEKLKKAQDKKLNLFLAFAFFIFTLSVGAYLYTVHINNNYFTLNNNLRLQELNLKQKLNSQIEKKFLTKIRVNIAKKIKFTLSNISSVHNLKVNEINVYGKQFVINGKIIGGYRDFVKNYDVLKIKVLKMGDSINYIVSDKGKISWQVKGEF